MRLAGGAGKCTVRVGRPVPSLSTTEIAWDVAALEGGQVQGLGSAL